MKRVCVVCEGQTEEEFVLQVLAPGFYDLGLNLIPEMIETSPRLRIERRPSARGCGESITSMRPSYGPAGSLYASSAPT